MKKKKNESITPRDIIPLRQWSWNNSANNWSYISNGNGVWSGCIPTTELIDFKKFLIEKVIVLGKLDIDFY